MNFQSFFLFLSNFFSYIVIYSVPSSQFLSDLSYFPTHPISCSHSFSPYPPPPPPPTKTKTQEKQQKPEVLSKTGFYGWLIQIFEGQRWKETQRRQLPAVPGQRDFRGHCSKEAIGSRCYQRSGQKEGTRFLESPLIQVK